MSSGGFLCHITYKDIRYLIPVLFGVDGAVEVAVALAVVEEASVLNVVGLEVL